jgi:hypothetical protein
MRICSTELALIVALAIVLQHEQLVDHNADQTDEEADFQPERNWAKEKPNTKITSSARLSRA